jgi:hypothetical protein
MPSFLPPQYIKEFILYKFLFFLENKMRELRRTRGAIKQDYKNLDIT